MKKNTLLGVIAAVAVIFGAALAVAPQGVLSWFGAETDEAGEFVARMLGASLIGKAVIFYSIRNLAPSVAKSGAYWGGLVTVILFTIFSVAAVNDDVLGAVGWTVVGLGFVLILAFAYLLFGPAEMSQISEEPETY